MSCGLRIFEIAGLDGKHVDLQNMILHSKRRYRRKLFAFTLLYVLPTRKGYSPFFLPISGMVSIVWNV